MRRPSLVTILSAVAASVFAVLTIWLIAGHVSATGQHAGVVGQRHRLLDGGTGVQSDLALVE